MMKKYLLAWGYFRRHSFSHDDKRNLRLGFVVSMYGLSFAVEKLFLGTGHGLPDIFWFFVYGVFALLSTWWWVEDALLDIYEDNNE